MRKEFFSAATCISMVVGCDPAKPTAPSSTVPIASVQALSPTSMDGVVGGKADVPPAVLVTDSITGKPLAGATINFVVPDGGIVRNSRVVTGADGIASAGEWQFRTKRGLSELSVELNGSPRLSFSAMLKPDVPATLINEAPVNQLGFPGDNVSVAVGVQDRLGNPVPAGIEVTFTVIDGGGTVSHEKVVTDQFGSAQLPSWTLGTNAGANTLSVGVVGVHPLLFHAVGADPSTIKWFQLESLTTGDGHLVSMATARISETRIGFYSDEHCGCISDKGYFMWIVKLTDGSSHTASGSYLRSGNELAASNNWDSGKVVGDRVLFKAGGPSDDYDFLLTWIYKPVEPSSQ